MAGRACPSTHGDLKELFALAKFFGVPKSSVLQMLKLDKRLYGTSPITLKDSLAQDGQHILKSNLEGIFATREKNPKSESASEVPKGIKEGSTEMLMR